MSDNERSSYDDSEIDLKFTEIINGDSYDDPDPIVELAGAYQELVCELYDLAASLMSGKGDSYNDVQKQIEDIAGKLCANFKDIALLTYESVDDIDIASNQIIDMLLAIEAERVNKFNSLIDENTDTQFMKSSRENIISILEGTLSPDVAINMQALSIATMQADSLGADLDMLLALAPLNKIDTEKLNKRFRNERIKNVAVDVAKIAAGALIAVGISRKFTK